MSSLNVKIGNPNARSKEPAVYRSKEFRILHPFFIRWEINKNHEQNSALIPSVCND
jgi:hypothetical protein